MKPEIFVDGPQPSEISGLVSDFKISGVTTNPSLMKGLGYTNYKDAIDGIVKVSGELPVSVEVVSDNPRDVLYQGIEISKWSEHIAVKIPWMSSDGICLEDSIRELSSRGVPVNVTALLDPDHIERAVGCLERTENSYVSVFAGRIADAGRSPIPIVSKAVELANRRPGLKIIWASVREPYNFFDAESCGCHVITMQPMMIRKTLRFGLDLSAIEIETSQMFIEDAKKAGFKI